MSKSRGRKALRGAISVWGCVAAILFGAGPAMAGTNAVPAFKVVSFGLDSGVLTASVNSATGCVYSLQAASGSRGYWTELARRSGDGGTISFAAPATTSPAVFFFRVAGYPADTLSLFPSIPILSSGAVSLPDAMVGAQYSVDLSPGATGEGPYDLQISNAPPAGIVVDVISNNTANALARVTASGANLTGGQRGQFTLTARDASGQSFGRVYDLRVIAPPPQILTTQIVFKAGASTNAAIASAYGTAPLAWTRLSGSVPPGLSFSSNGAFSGLPTAAAAETNETGLYTNVVQVADSYTDRVTGQSEPRSTAQAITQLVRLSYRLNILAKRPGGPNLQGICLQCHGPGFPPDFSSPSGKSVIDVSAGTGGACSSSYHYITPQSLSDSLIYLKVAAPTCGVRMPYGGPYLDTVQINRLGRWILELNFTDSD
jgi:hypothetical protein